MSYAVYIYFVYAVLGRIRVVETLKTLKAQGSEVIRQEELRGIMDDRVWSLCTTMTIV